MEIYKPFWNIYRLSERVKKNKEQCPHFFQRLLALGELGKFIEKEEIRHFPPSVKEALEKLNTILVTAEDLVKRFNEAHVLNQMVKSTDFREEFDSLNKSLNDAFITLSSALHIYQGQELDELETKLKEQEEKVSEQEEKLYEQEKKLQEQKQQLEEQGDALQRVETKLEKEMNRYYCAVQ